MGEPFCSESQLRFYVRPVRRLDVRRFGAVRMTVRRCPDGRPVPVPSLYSGFGAVRMTFRRCPDGRPVRVPNLYSEVPFLCTKFVFGNSVVVVQSVIQVQLWPRQGVRLYCSTGSGVAFPPKKQGGTSGLDDCFDGFIDATFGQRDRARGQFVRSASPNDRPSQPRASDRSFARRPADRAATCALSHATRDEYRWDGGGQSS